MVQQPVYLLNLNQDPITVTVTYSLKKTYTLSPYQYVDISSLIPSPSGDITVQVSGGGTANIGLIPYAETQTIYVSGSNIIEVTSSVYDILKEFLYNNILKNINAYLANVYQGLLSLIAEYASHKKLSQSTLSEVSSNLQEINNIIQNAIQFEKETSISFDSVSVYQQIYNNLNNIYESLINHILTGAELISAKLDISKYDTPYASAIASTYNTQFYDKAITYVPYLGSETRYIRPMSQDQVLSQIQAGDISSLQSEISEVPPDMVPVVNAVTQLYKIYDLPNGTPLSSAVDRLLSDIREAYYKISNHQQEEVNTRKLSKLLQIYKILASNDLAPQSESALELSSLMQSGIIRKEKNYL